MTKSEFLNLVSKVNDTFEDEFKAEFNSPELIWDKVISKMKEPKRIAIIGSGTHMMAQALMAKIPCATIVTSEQMQKPSPFDSPTMLIRNYSEENSPISVLGSETKPPKRNSKFTPKKKKRKKRNKR